MAAANLAFIVKFFNQRLNSCPHILEAQSLHHWTAREVPTLTFKIHALETLTVIIRALSYLSSVNLVIHHSLFQMVKKIFQLILPYIFS